MVLTLPLFDLFVTVDALVGPVIAVRVVLIVDHLLVTQHLWTSFLLKGALEVQEAEVGGAISVIKQQDKEPEVHLAALDLLFGEVALDGLEPLKFLPAPAHVLLVSRVVALLVLLVAAVTREVLARSTVQGRVPINYLLAHLAKGLLYQFVLLLAPMRPLLRKFR